VPSHTHPSVVPEHGSTPQEAPIAASGDSKQDTPLTAQSSKYGGILSQYTTLVPTQLDLPGEGHGAVKAPVPVQTAASAQLTASRRQAENALDAGNALAMQSESGAGRSVAAQPAAKTHARKIVASGAGVPTHATGLGPNVSGSSEMTCGGRSGPPATP
jgi:hypothetical protein